MKFVFHPAAEKELNEAIEYYQACREGLGFEFAKEIYATIQNILTYPLAWTRISKTTRRCLTNRFPYGVIYRVMEDEIHVLAIMQLNRKPDYWAKRKKQ